jgi:hypothetical protein
MKKVYKDGDIKMKLSSIKGISDNFNIKFFTTNKDYCVIRTNEDIKTEDGIDYLKINWAELKRIGEGVLNYVCDNITQDTDYLDGEYNSTLCGTTDYLIKSNVHIPTPDYSTTEDLKDVIERDITSIDIPSGTTTIGISAFYYCRNLTSVTIPNTVTSIGNAAFYNCSGLTSITIPDSVTFIGYQSFANSGLTTVTIPDSVTSIDGFAFNQCTGLTSVTIGNGITSIGTYAFTGCRSLTSITITATTPPTLGGNAFVSTNDCPIYVPAESVEAYKAATNWISVANRIQAIEE